MNFAVPEMQACRGLVALALAEDLGSRGDVTSAAVTPVDLEGRAAMVARGPGILAGRDAVTMVCHTVDPRLHIEWRAVDGDHLERGTVIARWSGPVRSLLGAERTALNFVQRLSGIASLTRQYVDAVHGLPVQILDTRKTTPGWRSIEKYAVRCGGGHNHRAGLYDMILIKDNHLAGCGLAERREQIELVLRQARSYRSAHDPRLPIEIEVDALDQLDAALPLGPDIVLLDNMTIANLREAVRRRAAHAPGVLLEASGGVNLKTVREIADTGVDRISVGALTHSAPALDIALDYERTS